MNRILCRILVALAEIEERSDKPVKAQGYRFKANKILTSVVDLIDQPHLRASFINREEVRSLIEEKE